MADIATAMGKYIQEIKDSLIDALKLMGIERVIKDLMIEMIIKQKKSDKSEEELNKLSFAKLGQLIDNNCPHKSLIENHKLDTCKECGAIRF